MNFWLCALTLLTYFPALLCETVSGHNFHPDSCIRVSSQLWYYFAWLFPQTKRWYWTFASHVGPHKDSEILPSKKCFHWQGSLTVCFLFFTFTGLQSVLPTLYTWLVQTIKRYYTLRNYLCYPAFQPTLLEHFQCPQLFSRVFPCKTSAMLQLGVCQMPSSSITPSMCGLVTGLLWVPKSFVVSLSSHQHPPPGMLQLAILP